MEVKGEAERRILNRLARTEGQVLRVRTAHERAAESAGTYVGGCIRDQSAGAARAKIGRMVRPLSHVS